MRVLSLEYHDVVESEHFDASGFPGQGPASYKLLREDFSRHLAAIASRVKQTPGRAPEALVSAAGKAPLFITFDDGGVSAWTIIADALERHGWRGHFFVTAGRVGSPTFLNPVQMRELSARGHVIGSHSYSHPTRMGACTRVQLQEEWTRSVQMLSDMLGTPVETASVPGGFYTPPVGETAAEAGLKVLFTSAPTTRTSRIHDCCIVGRYTLRRWSTAQEAAGLAAGDSLVRVRQSMLYGALHLVRALAGDHYTRIRQNFWARR